MASSKREFEGLVKRLRMEVKTSIELRDAIELLVKITRNVITENVKPEHMQLKCSNAKLKQTLMRFPSGKKLLLASGWMEDVDDVSGEVVLKLYAKDYLRDLVDVLTANRNVTPLDCEWVEDTKTIISNPVKDAYAEDRRRNIEESKAMAAAKIKEKAEQKELSEMIKKEHKADREYRNIRQPRSDAQIKAAEFGSVRRQQALKNKNNDPEEPPNTNEADVL